MQWRNTITTKVLSFIRLVWQNTFHDSVWSINKSPAVIYFVLACFTGGVDSLNFMFAHPAIDISMDTGCMVGVEEIKSKL